MKERIVLESERLILRQFTEDDVDRLFSLLSDKEVMKYYPAALTRKETQRWLENILHEYEKYGVSWWAVYIKETAAFIGQAGLLYRKLDNRDTYLLSYMFHKRYWGKGYATEISKKIIDYGLYTLHLKRIDCPIRPINTPSVNVAKRLNLHFDKTADYKGYEHNIYFTGR